MNKLKNPNRNEPPFLKGLKYGNKQYKLQVMCCNNQASSSNFSLILLANSPYLLQITV